MRKVLDVDRVWNYISDCVVPYGNCWCILQLLPHSPRMFVHLLFWRVMMYVRAQHLASSEAHLLHRNHDSHVQVCTSV
jgi:hypothetical protein